MDFVRILFGRTKFFPLILFLTLFLSKNVKNFQREHPRWAERQRENEIVPGKKNRIISYIQTSVPRQPLSAHYEMRSLRQMVFSCQEWGHDQSHSDRKLCLRICVCVSVCAILKVGSTTEWTIWIWWCGFTTRVFNVETADEALRYTLPVPNGIWKSRISSYFDATLPLWDNPQTRRWKHTQINYWKCGLIKKTSTARMYI